PLVGGDPALPQEVLLTSDLGQAVKGADLVMLVADHPEYRGLDRKVLGDAAVYDGRGILDPSRFLGAAGRFASIGKPT
ncbi:MAG: nucleotide sugar dehydrogenase, partial [Nitrososphaera sp.]